ncbi:MAG: TetR family transcriptional regulator [Bryobacteraceae bacterium]
MASGAKSAETRARILEAAMELFRRQGFEETTMREIAAEAEVATGAAYYYFESKDAIVLAFYERSLHDMEPMLEAALSASKNLKDRIAAILEVKLKYFEPNRRLLGALAAHADPEHALSPFSGQTRAIREQDMKFFERALASGRTLIPPDLQRHLPRILWMYQMGLILFWIYDRSQGQSRTHSLVAKSVPIVARLVKLAGLPLMQPVRKMVAELMDGVLETG